MAENTHSEDQAKKLVSLQQLGNYHHKLLSVLGLVNDTAEYSYDGTRWLDADGNLVPKGTTGATPEFTENKLASAVDKIYDLAKEGSVTFGNGKVADAKATYEFTDDDTAKDNKMYINAKVGDDTYNICLDTSAFVKDSFLKDVFLLTVETVEGAKSYKVNGAAATITPGDDYDTIAGKKVEKGSLASVEDGTHFVYTWITENGEKAEEVLQTTVIAVKDIYGDLSADEDYIHYSDNEFSAITSLIEKKVNADTGEIEKWGHDDGDAWSDANGLATAANLADIATDLQEQINDAKKALTLEDGEVALVEGLTEGEGEDEEAIAGKLEVEETTDEGGKVIGVHYNLSLNIASSDDILGLFEECETDPFPAP